MYAFLCFSALVRSGTQFVQPFAFRPLSISRTFRQGDQARGRLHQIDYELLVSIADSGMKPWTNHPSARSSLPRRLCGKRRSRARGFIPTVFILKSFSPNMTSLTVLAFWKVSWAPQKVCVHDSHGLLWFLPMPIHLTRSREGLLHRCSNRRHNRSPVSRDAYHHSSAPRSP